MSSAGERRRNTYSAREVGVQTTLQTWLDRGGSVGKTKQAQVLTGSQMTSSESHPMNRKTGSYREGGPFYTSRVTDLYRPGYAKDWYNPPNSSVYTGPVCAPPPSTEEMDSIGYANKDRSFGDKNESQMTSDGTTAISRIGPINPASNLGTSLGEVFREGFPTLPGIKLWRGKTQALKALGDEYLNYQFGWAPLANEVNQVSSAARAHRELLSQYHKGEGSDTHRTFEFPSQPTISTSVSAPASGIWQGPSFESFDGGTRQICLVKQTKKWFEGCFTYGLPSSTDSWRKALGFGSDADKLFGLALSPDVLWELTPWSWAVDWFSNAGDVINNVTNFGLAGQVLRYGYMMEESIEKVVARGNCPTYLSVKYINKGAADTVYPNSSGTYEIGTECVTKRRIPASPFGFGIGWEGLSPTQLAITAALGITKLL